MSDDSLDMRQYLASSGDETPGPSSRRSPVVDGDHVDLADGGGNASAMADETEKGEHGDEARIEHVDAKNIETYYFLGGGSFVGDHQLLLRLVTSHLLQALSTQGSVRTFFLSIVIRTVSCLLSLRAAAGANAPEVTLLKSFRNVAMEVKNFVSAQLRQHMIVMLMDYVDEINKQWE